MTDNPLSGRRVLVVEDEMLVAMLIENMLAELDCEIIGPAAKVEQALTMIETAGALDAAMLDVNLNGDKSYLVADELAARDVPFIFTTGYETGSLHNGYRSLPVLQKPFSLRVLGDALTKLVMPQDPGTSAV